MTVSPRGREFQDRWWEIRMKVKPRLVNVASPVTRKRWHQIKNELKKRLEEKGFEATLRLAEHYIEKYNPPQEIIK